MIKFNFLPSNELRQKYAQEVVEVTKRNMADFIRSIPANYQSRFQSFFDAEKIEALLTCRPDELLVHAYDVYQRFPVLADRYWPAYYLKSVPIPSDIKNFGVKSAEDKALLDALCIQVFDFLNIIVISEMFFISSLLVKLNAANTYGKKRSILAAIYQVGQGNNRATEKFLEIFPPWISLFESVFDFSELSRVIGHDIVDELNIDVCLYCNHEPIQTQGRRVRFRTDLDHFYPRTKFPFLAVTLSNLIPSGKICNQSYKKNMDMVDYEHPFVRGVDQACVFHLAYTIGEVVTENNFTISVIEQGGKLDVNLNGFEIGHNYGINNELKSWVANAFGTVELIDSLVEPVVVETLIRGLVNVHKAAHNERHKKFKVDSINQFSNADILPFP